MKTKRELRQEAIEQLKSAISVEGEHLSYGRVIEVLSGKPTYTKGAGVYAETLIDLLTDDDSLTEDDYLALLKDAARDYQANVELWHGVASEQTKYINRETMTFPRDADGKAIRIGDELCGYGYPNGGVRCKAIVNERTILAGTDDESYHDWLMWDAWSCRHYHKPTVEDVLREFVIALDKRMYLSNGVATTIAEYAPKLQVKEDE
jgi:hypothetical protein